MSSKFRSDPIEVMVCDCHETSISNFTIGAYIIVCFDEEK
jgi:hypothetical protein